MIIKSNKNVDRQVRHARVRNKVSGTSSTPRLNVYRSNCYIYAQVIDDSKGVTLVSASSTEKALQNDLKGKTKQEQAFVVGTTIAKRATEKGIKSVVFDRGGYPFNGRVKQLADGARSSGLEF
jgi:large subunit ribosomal protein L18